MLVQFLIAVYDAWLAATPWLGWWPRLLAECTATVYVLIGVALYLDKDRERIRRHCSSPRMLIVKFAFAPVTLAVIVFWVLTALPRFLWNERHAGCVAGNRRPVLSDLRAQRDAARRADAEARMEYAQFAQFERRDHLPFSER